MYLPSWLTFGVLQIDTPTCEFATAQFELSVFAGGNGALENYGAPR